MRGTASTGSSAANSPGRPSAAGAVSECPRSNRNLYRSLSLFLYRRQVRGIRGTRAAGQQGLAAATPTPEERPSAPCAETSPRTWQPPCLCDHDGKDRFALRSNELLRVWIDWIQTHWQSGRDRGSWFSRDRVYSLILAGSHLGSTWHTGM